jgi:hypothetical protein
MDYYVHSIMGKEGNLLRLGGKVFQGGISVGSRFSRIAHYSGELKQQNVAIEVKRITTYGVEVSEVKESEACQLYVSGDGIQVIAAKDRLFD